MANASDDIISRAKPNPLLTDGSLNPQRRYNAYREQYVAPTGTSRHNLTEEGSYFIATNPTIGTAAAAGIQASFSDTVAAFVVRNPNPAAGASLYMDYLKLVMTVAPASGTSLQFALKLEPSSQRVPTGGNATITPVNPNGNSAIAASGRVEAFTGGAFLTVAAASSSARIVGRGSLRSVIPVAGDVLTLQFGAADPGAMAVPLGTASRGSESAAAVIIPPGGSLTVHLWSPSNASTGLSAEYEVAFWER